MSTTYPTLDVRRQNILRIILTATAIFVTVNLIIVVVSYCYRLLIGRPPQGATPITAVTFSIIFYTLFFLFKKGYHYFTSLLLLTMVLTAGSYTAYLWGPDVPQGLLIFVLAITMSGVLLGIKYIFLTLITTVTLLLSIGYLQKTNLIAQYTFWRNQIWGFEDLFAYAITFTVIALLAVLYTREIEKALLRARRSEAALKQERDQLEIKVEARTKELKQLQMDKMMQLYRLADFGRMAAGLVHDLVSPLTDITLNLEILNQQGAHNQLKQAIKSARRMENFVLATRQQLHGQDGKTYFNLTTEIQQVVEFLRPKARAAHVTLTVQAPPGLKTYGNPFRFNQLLTNLVANAIDAYSPLKTVKNPFITITLTHVTQAATLTVEDHGCGISPKNLKHIFEPFFTTKDIQHGTGIGLAISKLIAEKNFRGQLAVSSRYGSGTTFTFTFPLQKPPQKKHS